MTSTLAGMVRVGAAYYGFPIKTPAEWYADQLAKENPMNDFDRHLAAQATQARGDAEQYVERFNEGRTVYNPDEQYAEITDDGLNDFVIIVYPGLVDGDMVKQFTGPNPLDLFIKWVEERESLDTAA